MLDQLGARPAAAREIFPRGRPALFVRVHTLLGRPRRPGHRGAACSKTLAPDELLIRLGRDFAKQAGWYWRQRRTSDLFGWCRPMLALSTPPPTRARYAVR